MKHCASWYSLTLCLLVSAAVEARTIVDVTGVGTEKISVDISVSNQAFAKCLKKNLELSGCFTVVRNGGIKVTGQPGAIRAEGRGTVISADVLRAKVPNFPWPERTLDLRKEMEAGVNG